MLYFCQRTVFARAAQVLPMAKAEKARIVLQLN